MRRQPALLRPLGLLALAPSSRVNRGNAGAAALVAAALALSSVGVGAADIPAEQRRSGYLDMGPDSQAMQDDDLSNPATLWVNDGEALWSRKAGRANQACADCHGDAAATMKGVAARYPAYDDASGRPIDLEQRINHCREQHQDAPALADESRDLLALTAFVAHQSRGQSIAVRADAELRPFFDLGNELFHRREGQLNLSCAQCHDDNWGKRLAGALIPQAHPTGYPIYRLEWQSLGSLQRRLRNCTVGLRAEPYPYGSPDSVALELFLMSRARGMAVETPAVRP